MFAKIHEKSPNEYLASTWNRKWKGRKLLRYNKILAFLILKAQHLEFQWLGLLTVTADTQLRVGAFKMWLNSENVRGYTWYPSQNYHLDVWLFEIRQKLFLKWQFLFQIQIHLVTPFITTLGIGIAYMDWIQLILNIIKGPK